MQTIAFTYTRNTVKLIPCWTLLINIHFNFYQINIHYETTLQNKVIPPKIRGKTDNEKGISLWRSLGEVE